MNLDDSQIAAVSRALEPGNRVITGGAGTGKTTIIKEIVSQMNRRAVLMCPTGKAAARLREATGYDASTIHSALMWDGTAFRRQAPFSIPVIVDEASMVDSWLLAKLLSFKPAKLILVGDASQLPPVGKGQPFHDICALRPDIVSTLTTCHRAKGAIHMAATAIRTGEAPERALVSGGETWRIVDSGAPSATMATLEKWIRAGSYSPERDIIICPQYGSDNGNADVQQEFAALSAEPDGGIHSINRVVKTLLNPSQNGEKFTIGDRVICGKNFAKDDLWNGDLGTVLSVDTKGLPFVMLDRDASREIDLEDDDSKAKRITKEQLQHISHAYALSVHKAQGSQFRRVFFVVFKRHQRMLSRPLIYTAITRAREGCVVMGEISTFYGGINKQEPRRTVFQHLASRSNQ